MKKLMEYFKENKKIVMGLLILVVVAVGYFDNAKSDSKIQNNIPGKNVSTKNRQSHYIFVDIQGSVNKPGFYRLKKDSRLFDLLQISGGMKENADLKSVNQAEKLHDQQQIYIYSVDEAPSSENSNQKSSSEGSLNINVATVEDFQKLSGIGPKKAEKIIDFRNQNGSFSSIKNLTKVSGIGEKTLESLQDQITV